MGEVQNELGLAASALSVGYGDTLVIENLDLAVGQRTITGLLGPNGSGKSTLLRSLAGLMKTTGGSVTLHGSPVGEFSTKQFARHVGMLNQSPTAPEGLTVADLVRQGRYPHRPLFGRWSSKDEEACNQALSLTEMAPLKDRSLQSLSGGQRQRAWISMVLAQETETLLLDEPTTFLDLAHQIEILELLKHLVSQRGKTIVAVLHDVNLAARYADKIVLLKEGGIVASGNPDETITASHMQQVFGVECQILRDPYTGTPLVVPASTPRSFVS